MRNLKYMIRNKLYFENLVGLGNLFLEKVFFSFDNQPIMFSCVNENRIRFFCICTDSIKDFSWIIVRANGESFVKLLKNKISVYDFIIQSKNCILVELCSIGYKCIKFKAENIPEDELPDKDLYLNYEGAEKYIRETISVSPTIKHKMSHMVTVNGLNSNKKLRSIVRVKNKSISKRSVKKKNHAIYG